MTDIGLTAKIGDSPTKFEIWFRKRKPNDTYILQSTSEDIKKAWAEELSQLLWKQAIKNRGNSLKILFFTQSFYSTFLRFTFEDLHKIVTLIISFFLLNCRNKNGRNVIHGYWKQTLPRHTTQR